MTCQFVLKDANDRWKGTSLLGAHSFWLLGRIFEILFPGCVVHVAEFVQFVSWLVQEVWYLSAIQSIIGKWESDRQVL